MFPPQRISKLARGFDEIGESGLAEFVLKLCNYLTEFHCCFILEELLSQVFECNTLQGFCFV